MSKNSITDFTTLINNQLKAHQDLGDHLIQIEGIFEFMLTGDFSQVNMAALQSQLMSVDKLVHEAKTMNEVLQTMLTDKILPQLVGVEKQV